MKVKIIKSCFGGVEFLAQPKVLVLGGVGSAGVERLEFTLPREWAGMAVTLHIEQEGGGLPQPILLDAANSAMVDKRFTAVRRGIWMLLAVDGKGYTAMTRPAEYRCSPSIDLNPTLEDIPESVYEQFIARVLKDAAAAQAAAASAEQDAKAAQEAAALSQKAALEAAEQAGKAGEGLTNRERWWLLELLRRAAYTDPASKDILAKLGEAWETVRVEQIVLSQSYQALEAGADFTLTADVLPDDAADKTVSWTTGNSDVVALTPGGTDNQTCTVRAMGEGIAMIAAKAGAKQAVCAVYVKAAVVAAESIRLDKTSAAVTEGGTLTLTATVLPDNATDRTVSWAVSPADVAEITTNGATCTVNIKAAGSALVTASAQGCTASCTITATEKPVEVVSVTLSSETLDLTEEDTARLTATVLPENATDRTVTWTSSNPNTATVADGVVTAVGEGTARITAQAGNKTASCTVNVAAKKVYYSIAYRLTHVNTSSTLVVVEKGKSYATHRPDRRERLQAGKRQLYDGRHGHRRGRRRGGDRQRDGEHHPDGQRRRHPGDEREPEPHESGLDRGRQRRADRSREAGRCAEQGRDMEQQFERGERFGRRSKGREYRKRCGAGNCRRRERSMHRECNKENEHYETVCIRSHEQWTEFS